MARRARSDGGFALLLVLFLLSLLAVFAVRFGLESQVVRSAAVRRVETLVHEQALRAGFLEAKRVLLHDLAQDLANPDPKDHLNEPWASPFEISIGEILPAGRQAAVRIHIRDEGALLRLSALVGGQGQVIPVERERLAQLVAKVPEDGTPREALLEALADWQDRAPPGEPETGPFEANAKNAPVDTMKELLLIPGFTPRFVFGYAGEDGERVRGLADFATSRWGDGLVNVNTALPEVLETLHENFTPARAAQLVARRQEAPFASVQEVANGFPDWTTFMQDVAGKLRTRSLFFAVEVISAIGRAEGRRGSSRRVVVHCLRGQDDLNIFYTEPLSD